ncbi:MAG: helix-turn-helix domain-containing protein [Deltaproteobacteria bacterium]|nr:helix-turn-helix domain-containing protein [Deltaproteobacteria bacterium]
MQSKETLTEQEAAAFLSISRASLRQSRMNRTRKNRLPPPPFCKVGRRVIYIRSDLQKWLEAHRIQP